MTRKKYKNEDIIKYAKEVKSMAGLLRKLGRDPKGSNYMTMEKKLHELDIDVSHWTGQGWNKDKRLKDWDSYKQRGSIKKNLLIDRGAKCEICGLTEWRGKPITFELHHIDGNNTNNELSNLQILCLMCHSQTESFRKPKRPSNGNYQKKEIKYCSCGNIIKDKRSKKCKDCYLKQVTMNKLDDSMVDTLKNMIPQKGIRGTAKELNVSHTAVRSYIKKHNLTFDLNCMDCGIKLDRTALRCKSCEVRYQQKNLNKSRLK